ncbi:hypothetical protein RRF57_011233 [Xylaria bambusicola]|uniref:Uncharacterized protein n=1 Tax=Xylaria bambusicola TaxID=326684 RepID=A0AAN7UY93_9PEZI
MAATQVVDETTMARTTARQKVALVNVIRISSNGWNEKKRERLVFDQGFVREKYCADSQSCRDECER